jgi:hypothetical protein
MNYWLRNRRMIRIWLASGTLLAFSGCGLTDQQLTQIWQSVLTTGLSALVQSVITFLTTALTTV